MDDEVRYEDFFQKILKVGKEVSVMTKEIYEIDWSDWTDEVKDAVKQTREDLADILKILGKYVG